MILNHKHLAVSAIAICTIATGMLVSSLSYSSQVVAKSKLMIKAAWGRSAGVSSGIDCPLYGTGVQINVCSQIYGKIFKDYNGDHINNDGAYFVNYPVKLYKWTTLIQTTLTQTDWSYVFSYYWTEDTLLSNQYRIGIAKPASWLRSQKDVGGSDKFDSDMNTFSSTIFGLWKSDVITFITTVWSPVIYTTDTHINWWFRGATTTGGRASIDSLSKWWRR
jgi:hypothetical protein